jgi:hypothetical protein
VNPEKIGVDNPPRTLNSHVGYRLTGHSTY